MKVDFRDPETLLAHLQETGKHKVKMPMHEHLGCPVGGMHISFTEQRIRVFIDYTENLDLDRFVAYLPQLNPGVKTIEIDLFPLHRRIVILQKSKRGWFTTRYGSSNPTVADLAPEPTFLME